MGTGLPVSAVVPPQEVTKGTCAPICGCCASVCIPSYRQRRLQDREPPAEPVRQVAAPDIGRARGAQDPVPHRVAQPEERLLGTAGVERPVLEIAAPGGDLERALGVQHARLAGRREGDVHEAVGHQARAAVAAREAARGPVPAAGRGEEHAELEGVAAVPESVGGARGLSGLGEDDAQPDVTVGVGERLRAGEGFLPAPPDAHRVRRAGGVQGIDLVGAGRPGGPGGAQAQDGDDQHRAEAEGSCGSHGGTSDRRRDRQGDDLRAGACSNSQCAIR